MTERTVLVSDNKWQRKENEKKKIEGIVLVHNQSYLFRTEKLSHNFSFFFFNPFWKSTPLLSKPCGQRMHESDERIQLFKTFLMQ